MKVGDEVMCIKLPIDEDWKSIGKVNFPFKIGDCMICSDIIDKSKSVKFKSESEYNHFHHYPMNCFKVIKVNAINDINYNIKKYTEDDLENAWFINENMFVNLQKLNKKKQTITTIVYNKDGKDRRIGNDEWHYTQFLSGLNDGSKKLIPNPFVKKNQLLNYLKK